VERQAAAGAVDPVDAGDAGLDPDPVGFKSGPHPGGNFSVLGR
jgi:hypothetical protein